MSNVGLGSQRRTILLIDDDPHARARLRQTLEAAGFTVGEAASGQEGERTFRRVRPDAVIVDLMLESLEPGSSAATTLLEAGRQVPIFITTTAPDAFESGVPYRDLGVAGVFVRPVDGEVVVQTLRLRLGVRC